MVLNLERERERECVCDVDVEYIYIYIYMIDKPNRIYEEIIYRANACAPYIQTYYHRPARKNY